MYKKILFSIVLVVATLTTVYAAFPVEKATTEQVSAAEYSQSSAASAQSEQVSDEQSTPTSPTSAPAGKSQLVALLLCLFVGGIGIHRFYLGYTTEGIIQILTLGGCGIWSLIDLIRIITGDLKPKGGEYAEKL